MLTYLAGGIVQLALDYVLVGDARIGIIGSPIGTLACYASITVINLVIIGMRVPEPARVARTAAKPLCISAVMGVAAYSVYGLTRRALSGALGTGRSAEALFLAAAVIVAVAVYAALIIVTRTITREDLKYVPKGDSVARFLRLP
jgi:stage V sporulation protein B